MAVPEVAVSERSPLLRLSETSGTLTSGDDELDVSAPKDGRFSKTRGALTIAAFYVLIFVVTSNVSLFTTIQSPIAADLKATTKSVSWFTSAYLISVTSMTPLAGRLSQIFSPQSYLFASMVIQGCGLLVTSLSHNVPVFLLGRVITGMGAGAVTPVSLILVAKLIDPTNRGLFFGLANMAYTSGVALGAIIAGALEPVVGWRAVFWLQIPISISAAAVALFAIPASQPTLDNKVVEDSISQRLSRIDYLGTLTLVSSVVLLLYSLSAPKVPYSLIISSLVMLGLFLVVEHKWAQEPIVPLSVLKNRSNVMVGIATIGVMSARWGVLFYGPVYVLAVRGWSQSSAGVILLPTNAGFALGGIMAGWLHIRRAGSYYIACLLCFVLFIFSLLTLSQITTQTSSVYLFVTILFINGFLASALLTYSQSHLLHLTIPATHVLVLPLNSMFRSLSGGFGSSISSGIFLRALRKSLESEFARRGMTDKGSLIDRLLVTPTLVQSLTGPEKEVAIIGYEASYQTLFLAGSGVAMVMTLIQAGAGWRAPEAPKEDGGGESTPTRTLPGVSAEPIAS